MKKKNLGGRPPVDPYHKLFKSVKFSQSDIDALDKLGFSLSKGVRLALNEFLARNTHNEKH